jgi:hypothetical protein
MRTFFSRVRQSPSADARIEPVSMERAMMSRNEPKTVAEQPRLEIDNSDVQALYANFCRVSSTPEEVILDLALNPNPAGQGPQKLHISQRVILNHYTAKRLMTLLAATLQRHEQAFGFIETDVRKRLAADRKD